jgi:nucleoside-diphosphate-sugar epimerase
LLGYDPQTQFKEGIKKFYDWFLLNENLLTQ